MQPTQSPSPQAPYLPSQSPPDQQSQQQQQQQQQPTYQHILQQNQQVAAAAAAAAAILHQQGGGGGGPPQPPSSNAGTQSGQVPQQPSIFIPQNYAIAADGYVAAPAAGFSAAQQAGPQVIRGLQSAAPPTPPQQQDLNKMQQPPPQMFVPAGGANGTANVRQNQQIYRGGSTGASARGGPRQNLPMATSTMYLANPSPVVPLPPHTTYNPYGTTRQQAGHFYFSNPQVQNYSGYQYYIHSPMMPATSTHRGNAVPSPMLSTPGPGMQTSVAQGQMVPQMVLTAAAVAAGQQGTHITNTGQMTGTQQTTTKKHRQHAIPIIHPITKENVLEQLELAKSLASSTSVSESDYTDQIHPNSDIGEIGSISSQDQAIGSSSLIAGSTTSDLNNCGTRQMTIYGVGGGGSSSGGAVIGNSSNNSQMPAAGTPVVSAMSDAPEIHLKQQHLKTKKSKPIEVFTIHPPPQAAITHDQMIPSSKDPSSTTASATSLCEDTDLPPGAEGPEEAPISLDYEGATTEQDLSRLQPEGSDTSIISSLHSLVAPPSISTLSLSSLALSSSTVSSESATSLNSSNAQASCSSLGTSVPGTAHTTGSAPPGGSTIASSQSSSSSLTSVTVPSETTLAAGLAAFRDKTSDESTKNDINLADSVVVTRRAASPSTCSEDITTDINLSSPQKLKDQQQQQQSRLSHPIGSSGSNISRGAASTTGGGGGGGGGGHKDSNISSRTSAAGQSAVVSPANQQTSPSGKMTLNEKEVKSVGGKSALSERKETTTAPLTASTGKKSSQTSGGGGGVGVGGGGSSDKNDNIITMKTSQKSGKQQHAAAAIVAQSIETNANNNVQSKTIGTSRSAVASEQDVKSLKDDESSDATADAGVDLNLNNMEAKKSHESILSMVDNTDTSGTELSDRSAIGTTTTTTPRDDLSDINDNRTTQHQLATADSSSDIDATTESRTEEDSSTGEASSSTEQTGGGAAASSVTGGGKAKSLIEYKEGQWSPFNQDGNRTWDRSQLLLLRDSSLSRAKPEVNIRTAQILLQNTDNNNRQQQHSLLPSFASNKRPIPSNLQMGGNRGGGAAGGGGSGSGGGGGGGGSGGSLLSNSGSTQLSTQYLKQTSMSGVTGKGGSTKGSKPGMIHVSLSLREDVKLNETENAWRPTHLRYEDNMPVETRAKDQLMRKVRGVLNKLTPEKFQILVEHIMSLQIDTADKIIGVMELVFEKAIDEPNFSLSYARLCQKLIESKLQSIRQDSSVTPDEEKATNMVIFRNALLDKAQREFQENVLACRAKETQLQPIYEQMRECEDVDKKFELQAILEEKERKIRLRSNGTVRFIGELYKISILSMKVTRDCILNLLDASNEDKLECLCKLLTTVGKQVENQAPNILNDTFKTMKNIVDRKKISSRVRFMLQDVIDLRANKWITKRSEVPKTMEQIQKETEAEQLNNQMLNFNIMGKDKDRRYGSGSGSGSGGAGSGTGSGGAGTGGGSGQFSKNNSDTWYMQTSKGNRAVDANKLGHMISCGNENPTKLGASSQFQWNPGAGMNHSSSGGESTSTTSNSFAVLSSLDSSKGSGSGPRNKGSFSKNSMERDRHDRPNSRTGSSHGSRENSSSRGAMRSSNSARSASHSYGSSQQTTSRGALSDRPSTGGKSMTDHRSSGGGGGGSSTLERGERRIMIDTTPQEPIILPPLRDDNDSTCRLINEMIEKAYEEDLTECLNMVRRYPELSRYKIFYNIFCEYLHLRETNETHRRKLAQIFLCLLRNNLVTLDHFVKGYREFSLIAHEILLDVPEAWSALFQFIIPLVYHEHIPFRQLWNTDIQLELGKKFIKDLIVHCTKEVGPNWTKHMWYSSELKWSQFMPVSDVDTFIKDNRFDFLESKDRTAPVFGTLDLGRIMDRVRELLIERSSNDTIMDYLSGNISNIDKQFIRALTTSVCNFAIKYSKPNYKLDNELFHDVCIALLQRYIDSKEELELECLYAIQLFITRLEHPPGLLNDLFVEMYENDVITLESLIKWRDSKEEPTGKGVAVKALNQFFQSIMAAETSDENN